MLIAKIFYWLSLLYLIVAIPLQARTPSDELKELFAKDFTANFYSIAQNSYSIEPLEASGKFYFKQGGLLRFEYEVPTEQLVIVGESKIWVYDPELSNVIISQLDQVPSYESIMLFRSASMLTDNFEFVANAQQRLITAMPNQKLLYLRNQEQQGEVSEVQLAYNLNTNLIEQLGVIDRQNNTRVFKFSEFKYPELKLKQFNFIVPEGVDIIQE